MKKLTLTILLLLISTNLVFAMGLSIQDYINDYNEKYAVTWHSCVEASRDFYRLIDQNFQKSGLEWIRIKTGVKDPITGLDGHNIVTYTEGRQRHVITTYTKNNRYYYVVDRNVGVKTLHEICDMFEPKYKYAGFYRKGFGFIPKSRTLLMHECGHKVDKTDDAWSKIGKDEYDSLRYK